MCQCYINSLVFFEYYIYKIVDIENLTYILFIYNSAISALGVGVIGD